MTKPSPSAKSSARKKSSGKYAYGNLVGSAGQAAAQNAPSPAAARALLAWFGHNARAMPWRTAAPRDPYAVVVSEVMLQQTQVATVIEYFNRWMREFPNFAALTKANEAKVLKAWEGLGYYNRARNLQKLAQIATEEYRGTLPRTVAELAELPGLGPYSARSVASIAFGVEAACVDGNVVRVLARLMGVKKSYANSSSAAKEFQAMADRFLSHEAPGAHNEAMMELGATICTKAAPKCEACPLKKFCKARASGDPEATPKFAKTQSLVRQVARAWVADNRRVLLAQADAKAAQLKGLYELPTLDELGESEAGHKKLLQKSRAITRYKITETIYKVEATPTLFAAIKKLPRLRFVPIEKLPEIPLSGPHAKWIKELLAGNQLRVN